MQLRKIINHLRWLALAPLALAATPSSAATFVSACDATLFQSATACSGYYDKNILGGSAAKIASQKTGVAALPGDFVFDGDWNSVDATKITSLSGTDFDRLDFGTTLFGKTIIGAHFGNIAGPAGNVTGFWLFDFGTTGASSIRLTDTGGFSNAVLYTTGVAGAVPEPSTWLIMLLGFGVVGAAMRRRRRLPGLATPLTA